MQLCLSKKDRTVVPRLKHKKKMEIRASETIKQKYAKLRTTRERQARFLLNSNFAVFGATRLCNDHQQNARTIIIQVFGLNLENDMLMHRKIFQFICVCTRRKNKNYRVSKCTSINII
jgi:hypothetical protein